MGFYQRGFSKSHNARQAEIEGRFPATHAARLLRVPAAFVRDCCEFACGGEWHHVSMYGNEVKYFDIDLIRMWREGNPEIVAEAGGTFEEALAEWREEHKAERGMPVKEHVGVTVIWLEWGGSRNRPKAFESRAKGCTVRDGGGKFVTVIFPDGRTMKKGRDTRGFDVLGADGNSIWS